MDLFTNHFEQIENTKFKKEESRDETDFYKINSFKTNQSLFKISISASIYEGKANEEKTQLFRAEWDNHKNEVHPQPHWQFYPNFIGKSLTEIDIEELKFEEKELDFLQYKEEENKEISYNFKEFHFSMSSGNWTSDLAHINYINNDSDLINWYIGLLKHLRNQFTHCMKS